MKIFLFLLILSVTPFFISAESDTTTAEESKQTTNEKKPENPQNLTPWYSGFSFHYGWINPVGSFKTAGDGETHSGNSFAISLYGGYTIKGPHSCESGFSYFNGNCGASMFYSDYSTRTNYKTKAIEMFFLYKFTYLDYFVKTGPAFVLKTFPTETSTKTSITASASSSNNGKHSFMWKLSLGHSIQVRENFQIAPSLNFSFDFTDRIKSSSEKIKFITTSFGADAVYFF